MKFVTNTFDPKRPDAMQHVPRLRGETVDEAWASLMAYLDGKTIGKPRATEVYTVAELEAMHVVGVYEPDEDEQ